MARKIVVKADRAPTPTAPFSHAIKAGGFIFCSGQIGSNPATGKLVEATIEAQTKRCLKNVQEILKAAGSSLDKVVRCNVYLKNIGDYAAMNKVYAEFFPKALPARTAIQAGDLVRNALIEIEAVALE